MKVKEQKQFHLIFDFNFIFVTRHSCLCKENGGYRYVRLELN